MITPRFSLLQDENTLTINIRAPYCSLRELDVSVDDHVFLFLCKPYYLRLHLPGSIVENDQTKSSFNADVGEFTFCYEKCIPGEHFEDLEFITKLLSPKVEVTDAEGQRKIVVLSSEENKKDEKVEDPTDSESRLDLNKGFGFAMQGNVNFREISAEFSDVLEIDPREVTLKDRRKLRLQYEQGKFNIEHYLGDFIEDDEIEAIIAQKSPWSSLQPEEIKFSEKEQDFLKDLPNISYNLNDIQIKYCHNSLLDILFAYCYDRRTTFFEENIESGWNIVKLAATFCWLDAFEEPKEALVCAYRRSLIYPLYRNFNLCQAIFNDVKDILKLGEKYIIKCLYELYQTFLKGDCCRYILNNLFIKDYITYIMKWDKNAWNEVIAKVNQIEIKKTDLGLNLVEIEHGYSVNEQLSKLNINDSDSDDTDDNSDSSYDTDSSSEDSDDDDDSDSTKND